MYDIQYTYTLLTLHVQYKYSMLYLAISCHTLSGYDAISNTLVCIGCLVGLFHNSGSSFRLLLIDFLSQLLPENTI